MTSRFRVILPISDYDESFGTVPYGTTHASFRLVAPQVFLVLLPERGRMSMEVEARLVEIGQLATSVSDWYARMQAAGFRLVDLSHGDGE